MKHLSTASSVVAVSLLVAACSASPPDEEATAASSAALDQNGNGCVILNPVCALFPQFANGNWAPDAPGFGQDPPSCMDRARQWSIWCGNTGGAATGAMFLVGGNPVAQTGYAANDTRCVVSLGGCAKLGWGPMTFGDEWANSDGDPGRCAARPKEWSDWCANPSGLPTRSFFEAPGAHLDFSYVAP
jgi:hypothetical protein